MPQEKCGNQPGAKCGADERVDEGWVIMRPGLDMVFEGENECSGVCVSSSLDLDPSRPADNM